MGGCASVLDKDIAAPVQRTFDNFQDVRLSYTFDKVLDKGSTSTVWLVHDVATEEPFACKSISKAGLSAQEIQELRNEVQILTLFANHQHIIHVQDVFEDKKDIHIVMQLCTGGELFQKLEQQKRRVSEAEAAKVLQIIMKVIYDCHTMNVVHRDIRPENFLLATSSSPLWDLRAIDFGSASFVRDENQLTQVMGSPHYIAPEILKGYYNREVDVWSAGVLLYVLLAGRPPFHGDNDEHILLRILSGPLDIRTGTWQNISSQAKDLVKKMLTRNPKRRITAEQVLSHPWILQHCEEHSSNPPVPELLLRLRAFKSLNTVKQQALKVCASLLSEVELGGLRDMFDSIDSDGDQWINLDELLFALRKRGARKIGEKEVEAILSEVSGDMRLKVQFDDFVAVMMNTSLLERSEVLINAFQEMDVDGSGTINKQELETLLRKAGLLSPLEGCDSAGSQSTQLSGLAYLEGVQTSAMSSIGFSFSAAVIRSGGGSKIGGGLNTSMADLSDLRRTASVSMPRRMVRPKYLTHEQYDSLLEQIDADKSGDINFDEFCTMLLGIKKACTVAARIQGRVPTAKKPTTNVQAAPNAAGAADADGSKTALRSALAQGSNTSARSPLRQQRNASGTQISTTADDADLQIIGPSPAPASGKTAVSFTAQNAVGGVAGRTKSILGVHKSGPSRSMQGQGVRFPSGLSHSTFPDGTSSGVQSLRQHSMHATSYVSADAAEMPMHSEAQQAQHTEKVTATHAQHGHKDTPMDSSAPPASHEHSSNSDACVLLERGNSNRESPSSVLIEQLTDGESDSDAEHGNAAEIRATPVVLRTSATKDTLLVCDAPANAATITDVAMGNVAATTCNMAATLVNAPLNKAPQCAA